jgi:hypothetical protein
VVPPILFCILIQSSVLSFTTLPVTNATLLLVLINLAVGLVPSDINNLIPPVALAEVEVPEPLTHNH